ncbi:MAG: hypothetical protein ACRETW_04255, partial [Stenotrophobium sp.]
LYLYGAAAALVLSFLVIAYLVTSAPATHNARSHELLVLEPRRWFPERLTLGVWRALGLGGLALCILSGLIGTQFAVFNFNMTFFWVVFVLGFTYLTALVGDVFTLANPWNTFMAWTQRWRLTGGWQGRLRYPQKLAWYPALLLYAGFIALELFSHMTPRLLSVVLAAYTLLNLLGAWLIGRADWFRYCEFFSVFFGLIAKAAPLECTEGRIKLRPPFAGLVGQRAQHFSLLLFILFMLSSTAFDGMHDTAVWVGGFWVYIYHALTPLFGSNIVETYPLFARLYLLYQVLGLLLSPFLYLLVYLACLAAAKRLARSTLPLRELALRFAHSLIPIALVYNLTHYFTLIVSQGTQIMRLVSDPFGYGWNLFGTAHWLQQPITPGMGLVWHTQVALILFGHIVSGYLSHLEALTLFPARRRTVLSQIPMLILMVAYTTAGLWILAQPITAPPNPG